jgi:hypothetical protein
MLLLASPEHHSRLMAAPCPTNKQKVFSARYVPEIGTYRAEKTHRVFMKG